MTASDSLEGFRFVHPVEVRFRDIDIGGHAHHSQALIYFEEARAAYWARLTGRRDPSEVDYILAEASVRFHRRVLYPNRLRVGVRVTRLRGKVFEMEYRVVDGAGELLQSGRTTQVMYDYEAGETARIPEELCQAVVDFEGEGLSSPES